MDELLTIGEFARRCGLSRSALRFYDQNGLLAPRVIDGETGYRYYGTAQLNDARLISRLRGAELPLALLREFLSADCERRQELLESHVTSFRMRAAAVEHAVSVLRGELELTERWCRVDAGVFADALRQVSFAIGDPAERADLGAVWVETKDDSLRLVSTDSYRLAVRDLVPERIGPDQIRGVIQADHAADMAVQLGATQTLMLMQDAAGVMSAMLDDRVTAVGGRGADFPDYERILAGLPAGGQMAVERTGLEQALTDLARESDELRLGFDRQGLALSTDRGQASLPGNWSEPPLELYVNPRFLEEAVAATVGPDVLIEARDPFEPITLRSADTGTFSVLTMPIRPDQGRARSRG